MTITPPLKEEVTPGRAAVTAADDDHERVVIRQDPATGMRLVVAIHSTALGPALGGLRLRAYPGGLRAALDDVLGLARTMTLKASAAGLDLGGGKAVMIDDGREDLRRPRFRAAADVIEELGGEYITAEDIGTTTDDMDLMAERSSFVVGRSLARGGAGDPSPTTAATVQRALESALAAAFGSADPGGRRIGVIGLGKVGGVLAPRLAAAGAQVVATDLKAERCERLADECGCELAPSAEALVGADLDVLAPCAAGGLIDDAIAGALECKIVCGAANNPLRARSAASRLARRGILYVPDFLANCGGLIHVDAERRGYSPQLVSEGVDRAMERLELALAIAGRGELTPLEAAEEDALARVRAARRSAGTASG